MTRPRNSPNKSKKWNCSVFLGDNELLNEDFVSLLDIANKLGVSYARVYELSPSGRNKNRYVESEYITNIYITKKEV